jgi:ferrous iron transport protein A
MLQTNEQTNNQITDPVATHGTTAHVPGSKANTTLDAIPSGRSGVVVGVSIQNKTLCNKLLSMGIVNGTRIEVLSIAPLGDPMKIQALGYKLSLRRAEASHVEVALV